MKVYVLNPPYVDDFCRSARWAAKSRGRVQRHPEYLLTAVAVLEQAGHEVKFTDGAALNLKAADIESELASFKPQMAVLHTTTPSIDNDISYAALAKKQGVALTVLVGAHVSAEPEDTLKRAKGAVDAVARGEYDYILLDLAFGKDLKLVPGISFMDGGAATHNPDAPLPDVKALPFPAWHHIKPEWYRDAGKRFPFLTLISGRGCFAQCTFCREVAVMSGRKMRFRDPAQVVDEMEHDLKLFPQLREIMIETDTFTASKKHVEGVCEEILRRGLKITWSCNARVDIKPELLELMKLAGCRMLMVGYEFGTQEALDAVKKGTTLEDARSFTHKADELGFTVHGCFMIGAPGETKESARATIEFAKSLPLDTVQVSGIAVYPGTPMYAWAKEKGYLIPKDWTEWVDENYEQVTLLDYPQMSKKEIDEAIDVGLKEFYLRPRQIWNMVKGIRSVGDVKRKAYGLKSFVDYFAGGKKGPTRG
ncbi:MAG: radical SAM protein [Nitrospinae bacterium]|nr:radical SAM protein [Nitrospinota bacterium]